jgi:hypothetical protein
MPVTSVAKIERFFRFGGPLVQNDREHPRRVPGERDHPGGRRALAETDRPGCDSGRCDSGPADTPRYDSAHGAAAPG